MCHHYCHFVFISPLQGVHNQKKEGVWYVTQLLHLAKADFDKEGREEMLCHLGVV